MIEAIDRPALMYMAVTRLTMRSRMQSVSDTVERIEETRARLGSDYGAVCFSPSCGNVDGESELGLKTFACGGNCGVRYCSVECQRRDWRAGHHRVCGCPV